MVAASRAGSFAEADCRGRLSGLIQAEDDPAGGVHVADGVPVRVLIGTGGGGCKFCGQFGRIGAAVRNTGQEQNRHGVRGVHGAAGGRFYHSGGDEAGSESLPGM